MTSGWTNGEISIGTLIRDGQMNEFFEVLDAPPTPRQCGGGDFQPRTVTLFFSIYGVEPWICHAAYIDGPIIKKDGTLGALMHKSCWNGFMDDEFTAAPQWLIHLAKSRLAVVKYAMAQPPADGIWNWSHRS